MVIGEKVFEPGIRGKSFMLKQLSTHFRECIFMNRVLIVIGMAVAGLCFPLNISQFSVSQTNVSQINGVLFYSVANAAGNQCLDEAVSATGKPSSIGELARANAFFTWKSVVKAKHGDDYAAWSAATERKLSCVDLMSGENKGKWECTRVARPCMADKSFVTKTPSCKEQVTSAYGARKRSKAAARAEAENGWSLLAQKTYGDDWAFWERAKDKSVDCKKKTKYAYQCIANAIACK